MSKRKHPNSWQSRRDKYIAQHPMCEMCIEEAINHKRTYINKATEVHHIIPKSQGGGKFDGNLMALCHYHHTKLHQRKEFNNNI